ncbi:MAG: BON domain-containing protein [Alphaproteobacteria bacterium]|nr:BON domain-containing protein [Alphaproteobacteria bacterium]
MDLRNNGLISLMLASSVILNGCAPIVVGAAAGAGALIGSTAAEERGVGVTITDTEIRTHIGQLWYNHNRDMYSKLSITVREGRVLLMGSLPNDQMHLDAVRLAWQAKSVKEVMDEIRVNPKEGEIGDYTRDAWITTKLKSQMLFDKNIASRNYNIKTVGAVVYIMGIAQNQRELNMVTDYARNITGVVRVVSYARLMNEKI